VLSNTVRKTRYKKFVSWEYHDCLENACESWQNPSESFWKIRKRVRKLLAVYRSF
jgi:hypothetical protein